MSTPADEGTAAVRAEAMKKTTDLEKLKAGSPFTWGEIVAWHEIGPYAILEYLDKEEPISRRRLFHTWIDGRDQNSSFLSLDAALAHCIAVRHDGGGNLLPPGHRRRENQRLRRHREETNSRATRGLLGHAARESEKNTTGAAA